MKRSLLTAAVVVAFALAAIPAAASAAEWAPDPITLPSGSTAGALQAVSCPAAGSCVAVGESAGAPDPNDYKPMAVTEAGGAWGDGVTIGRPVGATATSLLGVSCPTVGSCVAVGYEQAPSAYFTPKVPVAAVETDGTWGETFKIAPPGGAQYAILTSVSCPAVGSCMAVGGDESGPFGVAETHGSWEPAVQIRPTAPAGEPVTPNPTTFGGVSCAAVGTCVGAGITWNSAGERRPGAAISTGHDWGEAVQVTPPGPGTPTTLGGISCQAVGSCVAVGGNGSELFAVTYADGAWVISAPIATPDGAPSATLNGVSCPAAGSCLGVGSYYPTNNPFEGRPMLVPEAGGTWGRAVPLLAPAGAAYAWLNGVSCSAGGPCEAVGLSGTGSTPEARRPVTYGGELAGIESTPTSGPPGSITVHTIDSHGGGGAGATCSLALKATSIPITRAYAAQVGLTDTGAGACSGTVSLSIEAKAKKAKGGGGQSKSKKASAVTIGSASLGLAPGAIATVAVKLNGAGKAAVAKAGGALKASLAVKAGSAQLTESVKLKAAKRKRKAGAKHSKK